MAATRERHKEPISSSPFLSLPLEVRQLIYEFCYAEPHPGNSCYPFDAPTKQAEIQPKSKKRRLSKQATAPVAQSKVTTKCKLPQSHLSLGSACRQVRNEWFPIFAREHVFSIPDPLVFANDYLSYTPPYRYSNIRHLAIDWTPSLPECKCEINLAKASCQYHPVRYPPVPRDLQNFLKLPDIYPELFNSMESIRLRLSGSAEASYPFDDCVLMFKHAVLLVEKMDHIRRRGVPSMSEQKYILAIQTGKLRGHHTQLLIFAVTDAIWDSLLVETWLQPKSGWMGTGFPWPNPAISLIWDNIDKLTSAIQEGRFRCHSVQRYPHNVHQGESSECTILKARQKIKSNWKAVFDNGIAPRAWRFAMSELYGKKGRKPPPDLEGHDGEFYSLA